MTARFRGSEVTRAIKATKAAGIDSFEVHIGPDGTPIIRVRPGPANDVSGDVEDEISRWAGGQQDDAA